jgi:hypothetical protein
MSNIEDNPWWKLIHIGLEYFGRYYSTYRGFVIDNNDPENMNRCKVVLPSIMPNDIKGKWALPKNSWGGKDYGINLLPQKGDVVYITFEQGDLDYPIWEHSSFSKSEKPKEFKDANYYGFKTPKGKLIIINDNEDGGIIVKLETGELINISKDLLETQAKLIKLGSNGDNKALLGEVLLDKIKQLVDINKNILDLLKVHEHPAPNTPSPGLQILPTIVQQLEQLSNSLNETLSNKVKLDK